MAAPSLSGLLYSRISTKGVQSLTIKLDGKRRLTPRSPSPSLTTGPPVVSGVVVTATSPTRTPPLSARMVAATEVLSVTLTPEL
ncbi:hypothetical protein AcV5_009678 [Taiwanofungus camphoratus]|nr:hypothetical protein AcV5_009678 [Antrodia cinnamomea]